MNKEQDDEKQEKILLYFFLLPNLHPFLSCQIFMTGYVLQSSHRNVAKTLYQSWFFFRSGFSGHDLFYAVQFWRESSCSSCLVVWRSASRRGRSSFCSRASCRRRESSFCLVLATWRGGPSCPASATRSRSFPSVAWPPPWHRRRLRGVLSIPSRLPTPSHDDRPAVLAL